MIFFITLMQDGKQNILLQREIPDLDVWLPEGAAVGIAGSDGSVTAEVRRTYVNVVYPAHLHVDLVSILIDPADDDSTQRRIMRGHHSGWYTERDGDALEVLLAAGWERWRP